MLVNNGLVLQGDQSGVLLLLVVDIINKWGLVCYITKCILLLIIRLLSIIIAREYYQLTEWLRRFQNHQMLIRLGYTFIYCIGIVPIFIIKILAQLVYKFLLVLMLLDLSGETISERHCQLLEEGGSLVGVQELFFGLVYLQFWMYHTRQKVTILLKREII